MDLSALESTIKALEVSLDALRPWLIFWNVIVVVGLVVEYHPDIWELVFARPRTRRKHWPVLVGGALIVIGISGEISNESKSFRIENAISKNSLQLETLLEQKAGYAKTAADDAARAALSAKDSAKRAANLSSKSELTAGNAEALARGARKEADSFEKDIVSAKKQAADAESHLAEALQRAAKAEMEAGKLTEKMADRQLTDLQLQTIGDALKPFAGQEYDVTAYWDSKESVAIAERIHQALQLALWKFLPMKDWRGLMGGVVGVQVWIHPGADQPTKKAAESLVAALLKEGIEAEPRTQNPVNNPKHNRISLNVGSKR